VTCPVIAITPSSLADAQLGTPYAVSFAASGGTAPYVFSIQSGSLPAGLSLANDGQLTGGTRAATYRMYPSSKLAARKNSVVNVAGR